MVTLWDRGDTRPFVEFLEPVRREGSTLDGRPVHAGVSGAPIFDEAVAGEVVGCGFQLAGEHARIALMEETRMKYGGVERGGH